MSSAHTHATYYVKWKLAAMVFVFTFYIFTLRCREEHTKGIDLKAKLASATKASPKPIYFRHVPI